MPADLVEKRLHFLLHIGLKGEKGHANWDVAGNQGLTLTVPTVMNIMFMKGP